MEIESVLPPLPVDPDTSILANEVVLENIRNDRQERPILISDSTPIKVSKKRKLADQQKVENDEDEEHIDWASSDEEEDLQKEVASFERNQVSCVCH